MVAPFRWDAKMPVKAANSLVLETRIDRLPVRRGKVRDVYDLGDRLLLVSTDRISAFDHVLPNGIPDKGRVLTELSTFWFQRLNTPSHWLTTDVDQMDLPPGVDRGPLRGRTTLVRKTEVVPIECVVRGYLAGSGWKEYRQSGAVCGVSLPAGLRESDRLPEPIFTPATKEESGHDINISFAEMVERVGGELAETLRRAQPGSLSPRGRACRCSRHFDRRYEIRMGTGRRRDPADRRSSHARQLAILAGG